MNSNKKPWMNKEIWNKEIWLPFKVFNTAFNVGVCSVQTIILCASSMLTKLNRKPDLTVLTSQIASILLLSFTIIYSMTE